MKNAKLLVDAASEGHLDVMRFLVEHGATVNDRDQHGQTPLLRAAAAGHLDVVRYLVEHGAIVNDCGSHGWTSLMRAARGGHLDVVCYLVKHGAGVDGRNKYGVTPLMRAARGGHLDVVRFLVEHGATVNDRDQHGQTPLLRAAAGGHLDMVRYLVEHGAIVNDCGRHGWTSLMRAAVGGHLDVVCFLVEHGATVDDRDQHGWTPLMLAVSGDQWDVVCFLVEHGAAVNDLDSDDQTPLMLAAGGDHWDVVRFLVKHGAAVDGCNKYGLTTLMQAASDGRLDVVRNLVEHGAVVNAHDQHGWTPLLRAAQGDYWDVMRFLVEHGATVNGCNSDSQKLLVRAADGGHLDLVRFLVTQGVAIDCRDNDDQTPLKRAVDSGNLDVVRFLVEHGADVNDQEGDGQTPLMHAAGAGHLDVVRYLVDLGATVDAHDSDGQTPQMLAARDGHLDVVSFLMEHGAGISSRDEYGQTLLMRASAGGRLDMVRFLVKHGAVVNDRGSYGWTPLMRAADGGHLGVVRFLIEHGAAVNGRDGYGMTPISAAASADHLDVVRFLVKQGASIDDRDKYGWTPLMRAAGAGNLDVVRFLMNNGAAVDAHNKLKVTTLSAAAGGGHLDVVRFLVEHGAAVDGRPNHGWPRLLRGACGAHLDVVCYLAIHGATVDDRDTYGVTPIMRAARGGHLDVVCYLMEIGATVDGRDRDGQTLLMRAADGGHLDVVCFLVEHGATVDGRDSDGQTPLMRAAGGGHLDVVRFLVEHGAGMDGRDHMGCTPLIRAAGGDHWDVVSFLIDHGAGIDGRDSEGQTLLMWAATGGRLDVVRNLVEHGAAIDSRDQHGWTPLMRAVAGDHWDVVCILAKHGAAMDCRNTDGMTLFSQAAAGDHWDVVRFLVEYGATVNDRDQHGWTPLMRAARGDYWDVVRFLVEHGATVNDRDQHGQTPLMRAARGGRLDMVCYLVEHGAAVDDSSSHGWTSLMQASRGGHLDVVRYLVENGANSILKSTAGDSAVSIANKYGRLEIVQFLLQLVRYQGWRTQTDHPDENVALYSNIPSNWVIPPFEIEVEPFSKGEHFGGDYRGKWLEADVVVKLFVDDTTSSTFIDEVRSWHQLRHPNVLKLYGVCITVHHLFVCECASNGSLPEYLKSCDADNLTPWKFLLEAALGLEYLHERNIVHDNLRGSNILIGSDGLAKLSGFGLNMQSPLWGSNIHGAWVRWAAPESLEGNKVSTASDVYSLGMCFIETLSGDVPYARFSDNNVEKVMEISGNRIVDSIDQPASSTYEQWEFILDMCRRDPRERLQMPVVVNKLEQFAEKEAAGHVQITAQPEPEPLVDFDDFDKTLWSQVSDFVSRTENDLYHQIYLDLALIYDTLNIKRQPLSILQRFRGLLIECQHTLDIISEQFRVCPLSATRARDFSIHDLHRRISHLLHLVCPQDLDTESRETEWKRLCREQVELFVSEASKACVMLSSVDSEEDRSAIVAVLRSALRNIDGKYTDKQLAVLQKTYDDIVSKSFEDVRLATTPEWFIPWFELEMNEMATLGVGGFGSVIKAKWLDSEVVVKKLEIADKDEANADKKREMRQMFEREVDIWFGLSHPHVVRLFGACHVGRPFFVCELAPNGTLVEYLGDHPDELWSKLREAALGVQYLHARGIVHGDLKGNNILIGSDAKAKVTDFGLSGVFGDDTTDFVVSGAWQWVAPECMQKQKPTFASDIYSLGMCIIEALRVTNGDAVSAPRGKYLPDSAIKYYATRNILPPQPNNCSDDAWTLIERMCKSEPADRMLTMTVVDELEKLTERHGDFSAETDEIIGDIGEVRRSPLSVVEVLAEMKNWIDKCDTRSEWEGGVLKNIYQLLWDRLEQVATQLDEITTTSDFSSLVEHSKQRTHAALDITGVIPMIKFTELALGGYALHRRLDKFMAAHAVPKDSIPLHDWTSACSTFIGVSNSPTPACSKEDCCMDELTRVDREMTSSTEVVTVV